ncbi:LysR family transcriptional regulator [Alphaproteobacteria bacterium KMM 3653]|uniref:LysR family transcriptional regulator n=1 Tax=Harenicola maris TaxID=2841044 RepID=A0AAP2G5U0_9RHOB|nr:LysR family transcriptional regulator [Harenicola maris]
MSLDAWDEVRTAYHVARLGTVSGAAEALGVHHATVIRHIDALEDRLGAKLFQRHARGYTATEAGNDLLQVAKATDDQFTQMAGRISGQGDTVSGELVITTLPGLSILLSPMLRDYGRMYPDVTIRFMTDERVYRLEYGEAHLAIRAGSKPDEPDNVVQPFMPANFALYATDEYIETYGRLTEGEWGDHRFVSATDGMERASFISWLEDTVPQKNICFRTTRQRTMEDAIVAGIGIGFMPVFMGEETKGVQMVLPPRPEWSAMTWLVTHVDLHRTLKVQSIVAFLKERISALND